ncbi:MULTISPECIES: nitroreductase family protein [Priestia]|uniref:nitroreductase family protein n=1 Tax=Priestia TaxID=2800373 RepID=UPI000BF0CAEB|nr:nitroreductase [Priestia aryabhattai]MED4009402.1 nitroreductase [Priestia aryabhattai]PEI59801.1 nitroreductase [Priestia aryabhattai]
MSVLDIIKARRTIGAMQDKDVSENAINLMLEAGTWAPNHKKTEPWKFRVFTGDSRVRLGDEMERIMKQKTAHLSEEEALKKTTKAKKGPLRAPVIIAVAVSPSGKVPEIEEISAVAASIQNMLLVAEEQGLATIWRTGDIVYQSELNDFLSLEDGDKLLGLIYVGHPNKEVSSKRIPYQDKTIWYR